MMREMSFKGRVLVTTMLERAEVSPSQLDTLYSACWHIEVDFRTIKSVPGMNILKCKSVTIIVKEIAVALLGYNLWRLAMAEAAWLGDLVPRMLSFKEAKRVLDAIGKRRRQTMQSDLTAAVLQKIASLKLSWRAGRIEPRAKKRRPINLYLLSVPREVARAAIWQRRGLSYCHGVLAELRSARKSGLGQKLV